MISTWPASSPALQQPPVPQVEAHALLQAMGAYTGSSVVHTLPGASDLGSMPSTPPQEHQAAGWRGGWRCCCKRIPQTAPKCLFFFSFFLFEKFILLNPAAPYKEGPVLSHSPPLQLDLGLSESGPDMAQLSTLLSPCPQSPWVYHFVLIPLPVTSSNQVSLGAAQTMFDRGGSH